MGQRQHPLPRRGTRGQVLVFFALGVVVFLGLAALVVDVGAWLQDRRSYQNAADAAALVGVNQLRPPLGPATQQAAVVEAVASLNRQLGLGITDLAAAALAASSPSGLTIGPDRFVVTTPPNPDCGGPGSYSGNPRAITVRIDHQSGRFFSTLFSPSGSQPVSVCATAASVAGAYAVAVLQPSDGTTQANSTNITMNLAGSNTFVTVHRGEVGVNATFGAQGNPPPGSNQIPAYVKFCGDACSNGVSGNKMHLWLPNPQPLPWSIAAAQIRDATDTYLPPVPLPHKIEIPAWPQTFTWSSTSCSDAAPCTYDGKKSPTDEGVAGGCTDPLSKAPGLSPGTYAQIQTGSYQTQTAGRLWLCPGVYHLVHQQGINVTLSLAQGTILAGQGVTLSFETTADGKGNTQAVINSGSAILLDCDPGQDPDCGGPQQPAPWQTGWNLHNVPIAIWIRPVSGCTPDLPPCANASSVFKMAGGAGIDVDGIIFGPTDNIQIAGNSAHHGAGEIWAWTLTYAGGSILDQYFEGPDVSYPTLVQ
jgi:Flp pilus assembly protein TadG